MKRRDFIRNIAATSAGTISLAGLPVRVLAGNDALKMAAMAATNDHVLIFVQLHGGNDALNTLIPIDQYSEYYNYRANIAIPDSGPRQYINVDDSIPVGDQVGLHPDMIAFKQLYDQDKAIIVQNVGYPNMNGSHFRGRDLVFMGLDGNDDESGVSSGWMGRFLNEEYPGYPEAYPSAEMPDPIAIEIGANMSLAFHREDGIPMGLNIASPEAFYALISGVQQSDYNNLFYRPDGHAGDELEYLWQFEDMSNEYAGRLKEVYDAGSNSSIEYPEVYPNPAPSGSLHNPLSGQLRLIARLLDGGIKTKIFVCRIGGFDTHASQVESYDSTLGSHAALLYHLSSAIKAFQDDLANLNQEERVLTMTFTEFGRRVYSNNSYGTDHGTSTPVFIFGSALAGKIVGTNPDLQNLNNGNLQFAVDYRLIYTSIVQDWFGASAQTMEEVGFGEWVDDRINLFSPAGVESIKASGKMAVCFPNPAHQQINFEYFVNEPGEVLISVVDPAGRTMIRYEAGNRAYGQHRSVLEIGSLKPGNYVYLINGRSGIATGKFVKY
jgi:uncharacterized protein (DUF1501 family)